MTEIIGWASSLVLIVTIVKQVYKQWKEGRSGGVSKYLYAGQIVASLGFAVYSYLVGNWVFIFTNSIMVLNGIAGFLINSHLKKRESNGEL
ncbi:MAG: hypothetical protein H0U87_06950 [Acidobacteria bacterium]|jgi:uncharacterized protein with PQ loop repeat|nr:hypothetical protein [Acidobacteriota bacterium]